MVPTEQTAVKDCQHKWAGVFNFQVQHLANIYWASVSCMFDQRWILDAVSATEWHSAWSYVSWDADVMMLLQSETFFLIMSSSELWEVTRGEARADTRSHPAHAPATNGSQADTGTGAQAAVITWHYVIMILCHRYISHFTDMKNFIKVKCSMNMASTPFACSRKVDRCVLNILSNSLLSLPIPILLIRK